MAFVKTRFLGGLLCATALTSHGQLDTLQCGVSNLVWSADTICLLSGTLSADFSHNLASSEYFYNSNPNLTVEWVSLPDSATTSFGTKHSYFYSSGQGTASFQFEVSHVGSYAGLMSVVSSQCLEIFEIPFEIVVQDPNPTTIIESNWEVAGASNGFPTCSSAGFAETEFAHPFELNFSQFTSADEIEWVAYPDTVPPLAYSEFAVLHPNGSGVADFNYANAIPGFYQGNLGFSFDNLCQSVTLPFEFYVIPIYSTAVPSDLTWESTHDGSVCRHYGRLDAAFTHPFNQTTYLNSNTVDVLFEVAPNGSDPDVYYYDGFLSSNGNGTAFFEFTSANPGFHSGRMRLEIGDECQYIELPFEFIVQPIEEQEVVSNVIWSSVGGGDTTCLSSIYTSASFNHTKGTTLYLDQQTIGIEWTNIPDSTGLAFYSYGGTLYSDSSGSTYMNFHSASPGDYSGFMVLEDEEECKSYDVPFAFTVASPIAIQPSSLTWSDDFSVDSTCSIQGGGDADFNHALDITSNLYFNYGTIDILWTDFPDSSSLSLGTYDATAYASGTGTAYINYQNASPGHYAGQMHLDYGDDCSYLALPFDFHVSGDIQTIVPQDVSWTGGFDGDTTCVTSGNGSASFTHTFGYVPFNSSTIDFVWEELPDSSTVSVYSFDATLNSNGSGTAYFYYNNAVPGFYKGNMVLNMDEDCARISLPFEFTVESIENVLTAETVQWSGALNGDSTCYSDGYAYGNFTHNVGQLFNLNSSSIEILFDHQPDSTSISIDSFDAGLSSNGTGWVWVNYSSAIPGQYDGRLRLTLAGVCAFMDVPFSFFVTEDSSGPASAHEVAWNDALNGDTTCVQDFNGISTSFINPTNYPNYDYSYYSGNDAIEWESVPDSSDFQLQSLYVDLYQNDGYASCYFDVSTPGHYQGHFKTLPWNACQEIWIPFEFTIGGDIQVIAPTDAVWTDALNGYPTCNSSDYSEVTFSHPFTETYYLNSSNIDLSWSSIPNGSNVGFGSFGATLFGDGTGTAYLNYVDAVPGIYSGEMRLNVDEECSSVVLPFQFTVTPIYVNITPADYSWSGTYIDSPSCTNNGTLQVDFSHPYGSSFSINSTFIDIAWTAEPTGSEMTIYRNASFNSSGTGSVYLDIYGALPGEYEGTVTVELGDQCQNLIFPLEFEVDTINDWVVLEDYTWDEPLDGDTTCESSLPSNRYASFSHPWSQTLYLNENTIDFVWYNIPDSSTIDFFSYDATTYSSGSGSAYLRYTDATPGLYEGGMRLENESNCEGLEIPFQFYVGSITSSIQPESLNWSGAMNGDTTCLTSGYTQASFVNPYDQSFYLNSNTIDFEWYQTPDSSDLNIYSYDANLLGLNDSLSGDGSAYFHYEDAIPGLYEGAMILEVGEECDYLRLPFEFTIVPDSAGPAIPSVFEWSNYLNGDTTCVSSFSASTSFTNPTNLSSSFNQYAGNDIIEWESVPDSTDVELQYLNLSIDQDYASVSCNFQVTVLGHYKGHFKTLSSVSCQELWIPFEFSVSQIDVLGVCGGTCLADNDFDGICDTEDECICIDSDCSAFEDYWASSDSLAGNTVVIEEYVLGYNTVSNSVYLSGNLSEVDILLDWSGGYAGWAGDLVLSITAPNGQCVSWYGYTAYNIPEGCNNLGDLWPNTPGNNWDSGIDQIYTFTLSQQSNPSFPTNLSGTGEWVIQFTNAYSSWADYNMEITLGGLHPDCPGECNDVLACNYVESPALINNFLCEYTEEIPGGLCDCETGDVYDLNLTCAGDCWEDLDGDGLCDLDDAAFCGEGTYYDEMLNVCLPDESCLGDFNASLSITSEDLLTILSEYGLTCNPDLEACTIDLNEDGLCDELEHPKCGTGTVWNASMGQCVTNLSCQSDLDFSGTVTVNDLIIFLSVYGTDCD